MALKHGFILIAILATASCRPQENAPGAKNLEATPVPIISQTESVDGVGNFNYSYETGNGIKVEEAGIVKHITGLRARGNFAADSTAPDEDDIVARTGSFSYTAPDGTVISLTYVADENGFQPMGDHLPTVPPVPAAIQRSLAQQEQTLQPQPSQTTAQQSAEPTNFDVITP